MISYAPLWETMKQKNISTYALINKYDFDAHTLNEKRSNPFPPKRFFTNRHINISSNNIYLDLLPAIFV